MYKVSLTEEDEEKLSTKLKFEDKISDKPYQEFFPEKVIAYTSHFHPALEQRARNPEKAIEPIGQVMRTGLRTIAKSISRSDAKDCVALERMLEALIKRGDLSESRKAMARLTFVLTFIGDHH